MSRLPVVLGLSMSLLAISACRKQEPAPAGGPNLTPPSQTGDAPAESAPPSEEKQGAKLGAPAPAWANLEGIDGKTHNLSDLAEANAVAVVFTCNHCPFAQAYEDRLVKFASDYQDKGVELVAINVSNLEADKMPAMKERATEKGFNFAYLYDPSQDIAREFAATNTPHAFVLDKGRNIVYVGAIDDNENESSATKHYLRDAVDAALAGKLPEVAKTDPVGCSIKYE